MIRRAYLPFLTKKNRAPSRSFVSKEKGEKKRRKELAKESTREQHLVRKVTLLPTILEKKRRNKTDETTGPQFPFLSRKEGARGERQVTGGARGFEL